MKKQVRAVFFDIDGTLYEHCVHDVPASAKIALKRCKEKGMRMGIATSRCRDELKNLPRFLREFPFDVVISDGGALVMEQDQIIEAHFVEEAIMKRVVEYAQQENLTLRYSTITHNYFTSAPRQKDKDIFFQLYLNTPKIKPYEKDDVLNVLLYAETDKQKAEIEKLLEGVSYVDHERVIEINSGQIDKSAGVHVMAKKWNIPMEEIMCIGDGYNDLDFLQKAGVGVAMGNGCQAVKDVANFVTKRIDEDGILEALAAYDLLAKGETL